LAKNCKIINEKKMSLNFGGINPKVETSAREVLISRIATTNTAPNQSTQNQTLSRPTGSIVVSSNFFSGARRVVGDDKSKGFTVSQQTRPVISAQNNSITLTGDNQTYQAQTSVQNN
jgi:hypothetical protein